MCGAGHRIKIHLYLVPNRQKDEREKVGCGQLINTRFVYQNAVY